MAFDYQLMKEAAETGGRKYAELCALAYRQAIAAHKLVEAPNKDLLFLSKKIPVMDLLVHWILLILQLLCFCFIIRNWLKVC